MTTLLFVPVVAVIACAALTLWGEYAKPQRRWLVYIFKPLTTILILVVALLPGTFVSSAYPQAIVAGLLFSLMGDIWLMLPHDFFLHGLASFLAAHICYIVAFREGIAAHGFVWVVLALGLVGAFMLRYLWSGLSVRLRPPVLVYVTAILVMTALAVGRALGEPSMGSAAAATGALLFTASDATLAINRFRKPFHLSRAVILGTYFAAQLLIALSVSGR